MSKQADIFDSHEKKEAWRQIWFLTQQDGAGNFLYRKGLTLGERNELLKTFYDFLDYERGIEVGPRLGSPDTTETERKGKDKKENQQIAAAVPRPARFLDIHDPNHYVFDEGRKWIAYAEDAKSGAKRGRYAKGYPTGLVVHWTAGHRNGLDRGFDLMRNTGMLYLLIDGEGELGQSDPLTHHGYHAGKSSHKYANGYVSDEFHGVEIQAAGTLTKKGDKFYSWFNKAFPADEVRYSKRRENIAPGYYHLYTSEQMLALRKLICWLYLNNPSVFSIDRVVGHDEVSPGRKTDPGGSVLNAGKVLTMRELRELCWNDVDQITELRKATK